LAFASCTKRTIIFLGILGRLWEWEHIKFLVSQGRGIHFKDAKAFQQMQSCVLAGKN